MTRHTLNAPAVPTQAQIDTGIARGQRLRSAAFRDALAAIAAIFTTSHAQPTQHVYGNGAR